MELPQIKLEIESRKDAIIPFDRTGAFDKDCNPFGYGSKTLKVSDFHKAILTIIPPNKTSLEAIEVDVFPSLPNDTCFGFEILADDLGFTDIESGVWCFSLEQFYIPNDNDEQSIVTNVKALLVDNAWCCIEERKTKFDVSNISSDESKKTLELEVLLDNSIFAACKGDFVTSQKIMDLINAQCNCCL